MPLSSKRVVFRDSYCSAPPIASSLRPPRLSRDEEALCPPAPLVVVKAEVRELETLSMEFVVNEEDVERPIKVERPFKIEPDPRQLTARIAAIAIRQPTPAASTSSEEAQGPREPAYRMQPLCHVPSGQPGPADPPRGRGRPKGSKFRPRIPVVYGLPVPPERAAAAKACTERGAMPIPLRSTACPQAQIAPSG